MHKHSRILIMLLALVLPAQGLATALLHCQLLESGGSAALAVSDLDNFTTAECHGTGESRSADSFQDQLLGENSSQTHHNADLPLKGGDCMHCVATCHGMQSVIPPQLSDASSASPDLSATDYLAQVVLNIPENPLRPPRQPV
jgi:hypothetical protein